MFSVSIPVEIIKGINFALAYLASRERCHDSLLQYG
jgi:hypothetical protein